jgi:hypothetical protein
MTSSLGTLANAIQTGELRPGSNGLLKFNETGMRAAIDMLLPLGAAVFGLTAIGIVFPDLREQLRSRRCYSIMLAMCEDFTDC